MENQNNLWRDEQKKADAKAITVTNKLTDSLERLHELRDQIERLEKALGDSKRLNDTQDSELVNLRAQLQEVEKKQCCIGKRCVNHRRRVANA